MHSLPRRAARSTASDRPRTVRSSYRRVKVWHPIRSERSLCERRYCAVLLFIGLTHSAVLHRRTASPWRRAEGQRSLHALSHSAVRTGGILQSVRPPDHASACRSGEKLPCVASRRQIPRRMGRAICQPFRSPHVARSFCMGSKAWVPRRVDKAIRQPGCCSFC